MTTTEFFAYLKSFRNLEPPYRIVEHDGTDMFPDGRHASTGVSVKKGTQLLQVEGFATIRLPLSSTSMVTIPTYNRRQAEIVPPEVAGAIGSDVVCCLFGDMYLRKYGAQPRLLNREQGRAHARTARRPVTATTELTVTLERACRAVKAYNHGVYGCGVKNEDLDIRALREVFLQGLATDERGIERQVRFIGKEYGGAAGPRAATALQKSPAIARAIFDVREEYCRLTSSAPSILSRVADERTIAFLFRPFQLECDWLVWAVKFWHHLNPHAFPIESSEVDAFLRLGTYNDPVDRYIRLQIKFRAFVQPRQTWLPQLWEADGKVDGEVDGRPVCSDNKLWDKMFMGLAALDREETKKQVP